MNSSRTYKMLLNDIKDNVWVVDKNLVFTYCNKNFERYGWKQEDLIGKNVSVMLTDEAIGRCAEAITAFNNDPINMANQTFVVTNKYRDSDRSYLSEVNVTVFMDADNNVEGYCGISRDVTERNTMMDENRSVKQALEVCGALCHEMAQPIQIIGGYVDILKLDESSDEVKKILNALSKQVDRIRNVFDKLRKVDKYKTKPYVGGSRIFDIDEST